MKTLKTVFAAALLIGAMSSVGQAEVLLYDNWGAVPWENPDINDGLGRQTGTQALVPWSNNNKGNFKGAATVYPSDLPPLGAMLQLTGIGVGSNEYANTWASPNKNWIGWDDVKFSTLLNAVRTPWDGHLTHGYGGFFFAGGGQGWNGGSMELLVRKGGVYEVQRNGTIEASGTVGDGWHEWTARLRKSGSDYLASVSCDSNPVVTDLNVGPLGASYFTLIHSNENTTSGWDGTGSHFENFKVETVPVPEPASITCLAAGVGFIGTLLRRRRA